MCAPDEAAQQLLLLLPLPPRVTLTWPDELQHLQRTYCWKDGRGCHCCVIATLAQQRIVTPRALLIKCAKAHIQIQSPKVKVERREFTDNRWH